MSSTTRTLKALRDMGYESDICERFIPAGPGRAFGNRRDLFNLFDIICFNSDSSGESLVLPSTWGIQCFTTAWKEHLDKIKEHELLVKKWLNAGNGIELWGWRKLKVKRGGKAVRWTPRIIRFQLAGPGLDYDLVQKNMELVYE